MDNILIIGSSGHAKVIIDMVRLAGRYRIAGLLDRFRGVGEKTLGYSVLGKEEDLPALAQSHGLKGAVIAIGDNFARSTVAAQVRALCPELPCVPVIHPGAAIAMEVSIGEGAVIMPGVSVNPGTSIGRFCILNTGSSLDHDSVMEDFSSLGPGVTTGGRCRIGQGAAIGIGSVLAPGVEVGEHSVVGAGSLVMKSIAPRVVAYGSPAKTIRPRNPGDPYL